MNDYDFCDELEEKTGIIDLKEETLYHNISLFVDACEMDFSEGKYSEIIEGENGFKGILKEFKSSDIDYNISFNKSMVNGLVLRGYYNDLNFSLINSCEDYDFTLVQLEKKKNDNTYTLSIRNMGNKTEYFLSQRIDTNKGLMRNKVVFYSKRTDLDNSFNIINSFVNDPDDLFWLCGWIMDSKKVFFKGLDINSLEKDDLFIDNKGNLLKKVLK